MASFMFALFIEPDLRLELLRRDLAPTLLAQVEKNRDYLRQWMPWVDATRDLGTVERFIDTTLRQFADGLGFQAGVYFKDELVGMAGFKPIDVVNRTGEIGYWLNQGHQGQGIMTKCARALVRAGFEDLALNKIEIRCAIGNHRSRAVAMRLGFVEESILPKQEWLYAGYVDHIVYSISRSGFENVSCASFSARSNPRH